MIPRIQAINNDNLILSLQGGFISLRRLIPFLGVTVSPSHLPLRRAGHARAQCEYDDAGDERGQRGEKVHGQRPFPFHSCTDQHRKIEDLLGELVEEDGADDEPAEGRASREGDCDEHAVGEIVEGVADDDVDGEALLALRYACVGWGTGNGGAGRERGGGGKGGKGGRGGGRRRKEEDGGGRKRTEGGRQGRGGRGETTEGRAGQNATGGGIVITDVSEESR